MPIRRPWRAVLLLALLRSSAACAVEDPPLLVVDDFDDGDRLTSLGTGWVLGGTAGNVATVAFESNPVPDPTRAGRRLEVRSRLTRGKSPESAWVVVSCGLPPGLLEERAAQACGITFRYSGSGALSHAVQAWTPEVEDGCHFEAEVPASDEARVVRLAWSEFRQPSWGRQVGPFRPTAITGLAWMARGPDGTEACLTLDDVAFTFPAIGTALAVVDDARAMALEAGGSATLRGVDQLRPLRQKELRFVPRRVEMAGTDTSVPVDYGRGVPVIDVRLNGQGPFRLVFDSGAEMTMLSTTTARRIGLIPRGRADVLGFDADAESRHAIGQLVELEVGGLTARGIDVGIVDLVGPPAMGIDGVLALGVLHGMLVTLDGPSGELRIERGALPPDGPGVIASGEARIPEVMADFDAVPKRCDLDTGAGVLLAMTDSDAGTLGLTPRLRPVGWASTSDGRVRHDMAARLDGAVTVGGLVLDRPLASTGARACTLGSELFREIVTTFDLASGRVRLRHPGGRPVGSPSARTRGFYERWECGRCMVADVLPGSPAAAAGLGSAATITTVDGMPVAQLGVAGVRDRMASEPSVRVGLEDGRQLDIARGVVVP